MFTTGRSMSGNSRRLSPNAAASPRMNSSSEITVARTGRRTDISEIIMRGARLLPHARRPRAARFMRARPGGFGHGFRGHLRGAHRDAVAHLLRTFDDDLLALLEAGDDLDAAGAASADLDLAAG